MGCTSLCTFKKTTGTAKARIRETGTAKARIRETGTAKARIV